VLHQVREQLEQSKYCAEQGRLVSPVQSNIPVEKFSLAIRDTRWQFDSSVSN